MQLITNRMYYGGYSLYYEANVWVASQSTANNSTTLGWSVDLKGGNGVYMIDAYGWANLWIAGTKVWDRGSGTFRNGEHASGTHTVYHDAAGNCRAAAAISGHILQDMSAPEQAMDLPKIPRKATIKRYTPNWTDEQDPLFTYENPAGNAVDSLRGYLEWSNGEKIASRDISKSTDGTCKFELTDYERRKIRDGLGSSSSGKVIMVLETTIGGSKYRYTLETTVSISNSASSRPTLYGSLSYTESRKTLPNNAILQGKNYITINFSGRAYGQKGATITKLQLRVGNSLYNYNPGTTSFTIGTLRNSGSYRVSLVAIDSRGNASSEEVMYLSVLPYKNPTGTIKAERVNNYEDDTAIKISGKVQSVKVNGYEQNGIEYVEYWDSDNPRNKTRINSVTMRSDGSFTIPTIWKTFPKNVEKTFYVSVKDKFENSTSDGEGLSMGQAIFRISTADGKLYNNEVKVATIDDIYPVGSIFITTSTANPSTYFGGKWEKFAKGRTLVGLDEYDYNFGEIGRTGGEKTHKLTIDEMPSHNHTFDRQQWYEVDPVSKSHSGSIYSWKTTIGGSTSAAYRGDTWSAGGGIPHNNMQPYIVVNMWIRMQ